MNNKFTVENNALNTKELKEVYLAGGCFWGVQAYFKQLDGVIQTEVGYANGKTTNPSYHEVCSGNTGFTETVYLQYDGNKISLEQLIAAFFKIIDPTSFHKQGGDIGSQYRTGIYLLNDHDLQIAEKKIVSYAPNYSKPILVEVIPLENYYPAETYHQDYLDKNPGGYCHINLNI